MNSRRFMSDPKLSKEHRISSNEYLYRHQNHRRNAQPMPLWAANSGHVASRFDALFAS